MLPSYRGPALGVVRLAPGSPAAERRSASLAVFDARGATKRCVTTPDPINVALVTSDRVLYERPRRPGVLWSMPMSCDTGARAVFTVPDLPALDRPSIRCASLSPAGRVTVVYEEADGGRGWAAFRESDTGSWDRIPNGGGCVWADDDTAIAYDANTFLSSPHLVDVATGALVFAEDPLLLDGRFSPQGTLVHAPSVRTTEPGWSEGAIVDLRSGKVVGEPGGESPHYAHSCTCVEPIGTRWSPDGTKLLVEDPFEDSPARRSARVWDVQEGRYLLEPPPLDGVHWIDDETLVGTSSGTASTVRLDGSPPTPLRTGDAWNPVAAFTPTAPPAPPELSLVRASEVPTVTYRDLFEAPVPPGWRFERCVSRDDGTAQQGMGCDDIDGYDFDRELRAPSEIFEGADVIAFGHTTDAVDVVVRRLSAQYPDCEPDGERCKHVRQRDVELMGLPFVKVERIFYEWSNAIYVGRVEERTLLIQQGGARLESYDEPVGWILENLAVTA